MMKHPWTRSVLGLAAVAALVVAGCGKSDDKGAKATSSKDKEVAKHDSWWCDEHGIPEKECSMCNAKVAKAFKDKGDWCMVHKNPERALSQCFICNPKQMEVYAAKYREKYPGKEPPPPVENMPKKDEKK